MTETLQTKKSSKHNFVYDVIIAGAGPVGLFLACELALSKCSVLILEKAEHAHSPLKELPFGVRGLSALSVEALDRRGLLDELTVHKRLKNPHMSAVQQGPQRQVGHFAGIPFHEGDIDPLQWKWRLPTSTETNLLSELGELETILTRRAEKLNVTILYGYAVTSFQSMQDRVIVEAGEQSFEGRWLVGCDGSRSVVRKVGGFEFAGTEPMFTGYSARVELADPEKLGKGRIITPTGMYIQSQPGYIIIQDFDEGAFHRSQKPLTKEHLQEVLRRISDTDITINAMPIATTWTDRARQTTRYRQGRILLAGDAAHIHSPLGGQGLNLGLGDAMNLGWKLAATIQSRAPEGLLDTYETERYPVGEQVLNWSRAQVAIMRPDPHARALRSIFQDLLSTTVGATYTAGKVWGMYTHYDLKSDHPLAGYSVPNFMFNDGTTVGSLMRDGKGMLIDFNSNAAWKDLADQYTLQLNYVSKPAQHQLGLVGVLIRPDGVVAWACDEEQNVHTLKKSLDRWFVKD
jgi:2-polyprenyl-6-methoxyphenol hydroxylase-like FAD-dependent oxidoreductase